MYTKEQMEDFGKFCADYEYRIYRMKNQSELLNLWLQEFKNKLWKKN